MAMAEAMGSLIGAGLQYAQNEANRSDALAAARRKQNAIGAAGAKADTEYQRMLDILEQNEASRMKLASPSTLDEYNRLISEYQPSTYDFDKFNYNKTVEDFMNPEAEKIAELAGLKTQASLEGQGAAKGSGALANMGYSRWEAAEQLYKDAQSQLNQDRAQAYSEYGDYIDRMQKKLDTINQTKLNKINILGGNITAEQTAQSDYIADLLSLLGDKASSNINTAVAATA